MIENECRQPINVVDRAESYAQCLKSERGMTVAKLAERTSNSVGEVYRILRIAKLPPEIKQWIRDGKLRQGNIAALNQYRKVADQIRLAQQLIAGENPPELEEIRARRHSDSQLKSWLPKTSDGLVRKLLDVRQRTKAFPLVVAAFENLTPSDQDVGLKHFTTDTRRLLFEALREHAAACQQLLELFDRTPAMMDLGPASNGALPRGGGGAKGAAPKKPSDKTAGPKGGKAPSEARPSFHLATQSPSWDVVGSHEGRLNRYNGYLRSLFLGPERRGLVNLSNNRFRSVTATGERSEETALTAIRTMRAAWDLNSDEYTGERRNFIKCVENIKDVVAPGLDFEAFLNKVWQEDKSTDPINLSLV